MKRHVQQAEQQLSVSKLTKYCTCLDPGPRCKWRFIWDHDRGRRNIWWVWTMTHGAPRRVNHSSSATRKSHASFFRARRSIWWCWRMTPVAHRIVNVYSSTTKYYSLLQSTSPVPFRTTLYYKELQNTIPQYYSVLENATKYYSVLKSPIWNVIDIATGNSCHPPTSPNIVPATKSHCHDSLTLVTRETSDGVLPLHPLCVRLSYSSTRLLSLCTHSYTLNEVFHMAAIRASKRRRPERANSRRSERCTSPKSQCVSHRETPNISRQFAIYLARHTDETWQNFETISTPWDLWEYSPGMACLHPRTRKEGFVHSVDVEKGRHPAQLSRRP